MTKQVTPTFTKDDFLGIRQLAGKYKIDKDDAYAVLIKLWKTNEKISFCVGQMPPITRPAVIKSPSSHPSQKQKQILLLHPLAHELFNHEYRIMMRDKKLPSQTDKKPTKIDALSHAKKRADTMTARRVANAANAIRAIRTKGKAK